jgi:hypothetical protein
LSAEEKDVATGADSPYRLGLIRTPPGEYRQVETPFSVSSYTASIDLSSQIPPVGDQGRQGSCVAWATGYYYKSWWEKQEHSSWDLTNSWYQFSPSFIYNQINGGKDQGSTFYDAFKLLESKGAVDIAEMPYNQNDYTTQPTSAQLEAAKPYRIPSNWAYFWIRYGQGPFNPPNDIDACKSWLASGKLLVMGIPIYNDFPGFGGTPPEKYYDYNETASLAGGHGVCIVGYDDNVNLDGSDPDHRGGFKMVNSWGVDWNGENRGFIYLSYDFVKRYVWEAWTMQDNAPDSPSITSLSSYSGRVGDTIHIYGNNFGTYRRNARVSFNGVNAQSVSYTNEDITVTIPPGATSGPLIVYDWEGTPTNSVNFTVTTGGSAPHISYIDPTSGQVGTTVNINGTSFGSTRGSSYVSFGSVQATDYPSWSDTQVRCRVPSGVSGEVQVTVTTGGGTSNGASFTVTTFTDTYEPNDTFSQAYGPLTPGVAYLSYIASMWDNDYYKISVPSGCQRINVSLTSIPGGCDYDLDLYNSSGYRVASSYNSGNMDEYISYVPAVSGTYYLRVYPYGSSYSTSDSYQLTFSLTSNPVIEEVKPGWGAVGSEVILRGSGFGSTRGSSYVSFGSVQATDYPSWSDTQVRCRVPSGVSGEVQVTVTTGGGTSNGAGFFVSVATFYFAEGYTGRNFQEYLCIGNLGRENARVKIVYIFSDGSLQEQDLVVQPNSRTTVDVNRVVGQGRNVSAVVMASCEIVAERPMYFNYKDAWTGGHDVIGIPSPSQVFYFAEGYTGSGFEEYICVLNPGDYDAYLTFRFQTAEAGEIVRSGQVVRAHTRATFQVNELLGRGYQTSLKLESTQPVVAERAMYFDYVAAGSRHWEGGHCVMGATSLSKEYFFAEGTTRGGFEEWLTLQNSGSSSIVINAVYQVGEGQGSAVFRSYVVGAGRRSTVFVPSEVGWNKDVSIQLTSSSTFLAERPMYFCYGGAWEGGHCVIGSPAPSSSWSFAEGYTGTGFVEYLCLQNPGAQDAVMRVSYYKANGEAIDPGTIIVPAGRRVTITVNSHAGQSCELACRLQVISGPGIMAERAMYFNFAGWDGGHDVVGFPH